MVKNLQVQDSTLIHQKIKKPPACVYMLSIGLFLLPLSIRCVCFAYSPFTPFSSLPSCVGYCSISFAWALHSLLLHAYTFKRKTVSELNTNDAKTNSEPTPTFNIAMRYVDQITVPLECFVQLSCVIVFHRS